MKGGAEKKKRRKKARVSTKESRGDLDLPRKLPRGSIPRSLSFLIDAHKPWRIVDWRPASVADGSRGSSNVAHTRTHASRGGEEGPAPRECAKEKKKRRYREKQP